MCIDSIGYTTAGRRTTIDLCTIIGRTPIRRIAIIEQRAIERRTVTALCTMRVFIAKGTPTEPCITEWCVPCVSIATMR